MSTRCLLFICIKQAIQDMKHSISLTFITGYKCEARLYNRWYEGNWQRDSRNFSVYTRPICYHVHS